jgi:lysophospholipase L1-like esterase
MKIAKGQKLVMIGDSITDMGRTRPVGEGTETALGTGYVADVDALLGAVYPHLAVRVVNQGVGGDTVRHLKARWQTDVLDLHPDWLSVMIGINDVWRQYDCPRQPELHVYIEEYEETLDALVAQTVPAVKAMALMTPFYLEPNRKDPMRATMDRYGAVLRKLARKHDVIFVDTQAALDRALKHYYPATLARDRVHVDRVGHMVLARAFLDAVGFEW